MNNIWCFKKDPLVRKPFTGWTVNISDRKISLWQNRGKLPLQGLHKRTATLMEPHMVQSLASTSTNLIYRPTSLRGEFNVGVYINVKVVPKLFNAVAANKSLHATELELGWISGCKPCCLTSHHLLNLSLILESFSIPGASFGESVICPRS